MAEGKVLRDRETMMFETLSKIEDIAFSSPMESPNKKLKVIKDILYSFETSHQAVIKKLSL
jgi:hypothetical protein